MAEDVKDMLSELLAKDAWTAEDYNEVLKALFETNDAANKLKGFLAKFEDDNPAPRGAVALKVGMVRLMLSRFADALEVLAEATDNSDRHFFQGVCLMNLREYTQAGEAFAGAKARGGDANSLDLKVAEAQALAGDLNSAGKGVTRLAKRMDDVALFHYVRGLLKELQGFGAEAADAYEQARTLNPACGEATFRLAYYLDLHGDEDEAMALYQECISQPPVHANALLNLAVLYDDAGEYDLAVQTARRVLMLNPAHARARLIVKDAEASKVMFYDEEQVRRQAVRNAVLDTPVTDFELSVRARNCLKKMNIRTLGDLVRTTEATLMSYKNFGETSLKEIKDMLTAKGLSLGQAVDAAESPFGPSPDISSIISADIDFSDGDAASTPVAQVEFSVRVRRALETMGLVSLGDLAAKSEADLLGCGNFGQTSLNEVHAKLSEHGLRLAGKR